MTLDRNEWEEIAGEPPLKKGSVRARLFLDLAPSGLWFIGSNEWRGMLLSGRDIGQILAEVPVAGRALLEAMREHQAEGNEPKYGPDQLRQLAVYERFFGGDTPGSTKREQTDAP